jgi:hypothetical protein
MPKKPKIFLLFPKLSLSKTLTEKVKDSIENTLQNVNVIVNLLYIADLIKYF